MTEVIHDYNERYGTSWGLDTIELYNSDINNRLARKKGEYRTFGNHIDMVIVVDRLLTGFDAPTVQTLFVDRNMSYANLIQAFSRTNRTYPNKTKGLIVTFRKPATMEKNVTDATILYSDDAQDTNLIYPTYEESKDIFDEAIEELVSLLDQHGEVSEYDDLDVQIDYVKAFQKLNNAYDALVTYDDYNNEYEGSSALQEDVLLLQENIGVYNTIKGSLALEVEDDDGDVPDISEIEFFGNDMAKVYDIDTAYINQLLGTYDAHNITIREDIEKALRKLNKAEIVKDVYRSILNDIDNGVVDKEEDIFSVKRQYFNTRRNDIIENFAGTWFVDPEQLYSSALQYRAKMDGVPNNSGIMNNTDFKSFKEINPDVSKIAYFGKLIPEWGKVLMESIMYLDDELK